MEDEDLPLQSLHVRLLVPDISRVDQAVEGSRSLKSYSLKSSLTFTGRLYIAPPSVTPPKWLEFVQTGAAEQLGELGNRSNAAILMIKRGQRVFAFTFGHGRHFLKDDKVVHNFGLRVALNALRPDSIRSVDSFSLEDRTVHRRTQASKASDIAVFGLDVGRDILRSVTGTPKLDVPFSNISGNESSLAFSARTDFEGLGSICDLLLKLYKNKSYKETFAWVDNIRRESNPTTLDKLNRLVVSDLKSGSPSAYLAPPEIVDWETFDCFKLTGGRKSTYSELSLEDYLSCHDPESIDLENLKRHKAYFYTDPSSPPEKHWAIFKCLIFETVISGKRYYLNGGEWFQIEKEFVKRIQASIAGIPKARIALPKVNSDSNGKLEHEGIYNERVCRGARSFALLDRKIVRCNLATSGIEVCDIYSHDKRFIHVKHKKGGSSSLSHLFFQAKNSSEAFIADEVFRKDTRKHLKDIGPLWENRIPIDRPIPSEYEVVLAFLGSKYANPSSELPFFSQLSLARTYDSISTRGFKVSIIGIPKNGSS